MQVMTESELQATLSSNIKKYSKGKFTQETLAEAAGISAQNVNDIEGRRRWPRESTLVKIANALDVEVYRLFVPVDSAPVVVDETPENERVGREIRRRIMDEVRKSLNRALDRLQKE